MEKGPRAEWTDVQRRSNGGKVGAAQWRPQQRRETQRSAGHSGDAAAAVSTAGETCGCSAMKGADGDGHQRPHSLGFAATPPSYSTLHCSQPSSPPPPHFSLLPAPSSISEWAPSSSSTCRSASLVWIGCFVRFIPVTLPPSCPVVPSKPRVSRWTRSRACP